MLRRVVFVPLWILLLCPCNMVLAGAHESEDSATAKAEEMQRVIPFKQAEEISGATLWRVGAILIFVLIIAVAAILVLKKIIVDKSLINFPDARISLIEAKRLSSRLSVYLIAVDGREYLLSQSGDSGHMLRHEPTVADNLDPRQD